MISTQDMGPVVQTQGPESGVPTISRESPTALPQTPVTRATPPEREHRAEIKGDPAAIGEVARLSKRLRDLEKMTVDIDAIKAKAEKFDKFEALKGSDELRAVREFGLDLDKIVTQAMEEGKDPAKAATRAAEAAIKAETAKLQEQVEALKQDREKDKTAASEQAAQEIRSQLEENFSAMVQRDANRWKFASKLPQEAATDAYIIAEKAMKGLGRAVSDQEANEIMESALDSVDSYHKERAKLYGVPQETTRETARPRPSKTITGDIRSAGAPSAPLQSSRFVSAEQAKREALERIRASRR